tara:strand:- start:48 stop:173 length:126 start_codon:yes stop_codon:yes gene_type:complete
MDMTVAKGHWMSKHRWAFFVRTYRKPRQAIRLLIEYEPTME